MYKILLAITAAMFLFACASNTPISQADSVAKAESEEVSEPTDDKSSAKTKPCATGSRLKRC
jgi:outer membrane biogenesis lipoprotein LolB